jgi:hypothetical protein
MDICKPVNGIATEIRPLPAVYGNVSLFGNLTDKLKADGWRWHVPLAFDVHTRTTEWTDDGTSFTERATALWTDAELDQQAADAAAAQAAAEAAEAIAPRDVQLGKATLRTYPDGSLELVSGPLVLPGTESGAFELWVDSDTGLVLTALDHASPRKTNAEKDAAKADKKAKIAAVKAASTDKQKLEALLDLFNLS